ncbi:MAG: Bax inhibitor-1 family protein, partial [Candidatus Altimarinota bacterium]
VIIGAMLLITAVTARLNKAFETAAEMWITIIAMFGFLFAIFFFADSFPINLILVGIFSALMGWQMGPTIEFYGLNFKRRKFLKAQGLDLKNGDVPTAEQEGQFEASLAQDPHANEWNNVVFQALFATAFAVFATAGIVFLTAINFSFLGGFLFIALLILIVMSVLNLLFFRSKIFSLVKSYIAVIIFTLYLLYDFDRLEKYAASDSWAAAIDIAVNIYLDIVNLFINLLAILSESN